MVFKDGWSLLLADPFQYEFNQLHLILLPPRYTFICKNLIGPNEIVTYLPTYEDIYRGDENEQVYIARILKDNLGRLPAY